MNLVIKIIDSGRGIPKECMERLFIKFTRLEDKEQMNKEGTGIGLSICKCLVESMGGQILVDSEVN
jgi:signal transduction histidine kinase